MIYLFAGDDIQNKLSAYEDFLKNTPSSTEILKFNRNDFNPDQIGSLYSGSGLFSKKSVVVFLNFCEYEETRTFILDKLSLMMEASNSFVFLEGKLTKAILDSFKKARAELNVFELPKIKLEKYDNFLVANAFAAKDKLNLWIYFRQAIDLGVGMEELIGVLFWKIKDMLIRKNFSKFSEKELKGFIVRLSYLLPEARKKGIDAEASFEQFLLDAF
ncbi:hypothetical protein COU49_01510 [Candidatus Nomurabacteria bacterium CG10_big_fil_rev_8_21_14_0_10_35_16]|uniref:DNA polymerase III delta N-terminal domain-containing protein n=1 Tax=Candidatus Nomurabacteria bacterium CG10_big_fil_rev_8_21_14_0_10_35_16 TaxID=1974731 RepID=A0A2H0TBI7_9BACT|nr:MAG: hypothetical protein COU49_01510 [Candidatus Nomurabacteria bacterium CG10_big_fil_rev_8_21_14_0_10_35_16]